MNGLHVRGAPAARFAELPARRTDPRASRTA